MEQQKPQNVQPTDTHGKADLALYIARDNLRKRSAEIVEQMGGATFAEAFEHYPELVLEYRAVNEKLNKLTGVFALLANDEHRAEHYHNQLSKY